MKNILLYSLIVGTAFSMASCMPVDNIDGPNADISGRIIDETTGRNIDTKQGQSNIKIWERSFVPNSNPASQNLKIMASGNYNNDKLFAGTYDAVPQGPWWPEDTIRISIGKNTVQDFEVTPWLKITDFEWELITGEPVNGQGRDTLVLSCRLEVPLTEKWIKMGNKDSLWVLPPISSIMPFLSRTKWVGAGDNIGWYDRFQVKDPSNPAEDWVDTTWDAIPKEADGKSMRFETRVWVKPGYTYYFRMGARVRDLHHQYNYGPIDHISVRDI